MARLISFFQCLFGKPALLQADELAGAIDLSDVSYCMSLLSGESESATTAEPAIIPRIAS
jgi:hypothetical protein